MKRLYVSLKYSSFINKLLLISILSHSPMNKDLEKLKKTVIHFGPKCNFKHYGGRQTEVMGSVISSGVE